MLQHSRNEAAKELAHSPLLLTFLCLVYSRSQNFPDNRSVLYRKALRILLEEWSAEKQINRESIYEGLHTELEEILLSEIACQCFVQDQLFFPKEDVLNAIERFLTDNLNVPQHLNRQKVLDAIAIQQGILVERAEDIFSFSHLTLQEYLTAKYIDDYNQIQNLVTNYITDTRWKEVFLLVAGLMNRGADELLLLMMVEAEKYLATDTGKQYLVPILQWAENVTKNSKGDLSPVAKRVIANTNANVSACFYTLAYPYPSSSALALADALADDDASNSIYSNFLANPYSPKYFIQYVQELAQLPEIYANLDFQLLINQLKTLQDNLPSKDQPKSVHQEFTQKIINTWLFAFKLTPELINVPEEVLEEADEMYFYILWLMVECKQAAVRVSPSTWKDIEERMVRVPGISNDIKPKINN